MKPIKEIVLSTFNKTQIHEEEPEWDTPRKRLDTFFRIAISFQFLSLILYISINTMINIGNFKFDSHYVYIGDNTKYADWLAPLIDNLLYFQLLCGSCFILWYTFSMDDQFDQDTNAVAMDMN